MDKLKQKFERTKVPPTPACTLLPLNKSNILFQLFKSSRAPLRPLTHRITHTGTIDILVRRALRAMTLWRDTWSGVLVNNVVVAMAKAIQLC